MSVPLAYSGSNLSAQESVEDIFFQLATALREDTEGFAEDIYNIAQTVIAEVTNGADIRVKDLFSRDGVSNVADDVTSANFSDLNENLSGYVAVAHRMRMVLQIVEERTGVRLGSSKLAKVAASGAQLTSIYGLYVAISNVIQYSIKIHTKSYSTTLPSDYKSLYFALSLLCVESIFFLSPTKLAYKFAFRSTRYISNNVLYRVRKYSMDVYRLMMSTVHYIMRDIPINLFRLLLGKSQDSSEESLSLNHILGLLGNIVSQNLLISQFSADDASAKAYEWVKTEMLETLELLDRSGESEVLRLTQEVRDKIEELSEQDLIKKITPFYEISPPDDIEDTVDNLLNEGLHSLSDLAYKNFEELVSLITEYINKAIEWLSGSLEDSLVEVYRVSTIVLKTLNESPDSDYAYTL